jgi:hypothetical protein
MYRLFQGLEPVCLYTYETAHSRDYIIQIQGDEAYNAFKSYVDRHFGPNRMDNKVTLVLRGKNQTLYATYWDGKIHIGMSIQMFANLESPANKYRTIKPVKEMITNILNKM